MTEGDARPRPPLAAVAAVLLIALAVRVAAIAAQPALLEDDPDGYRRLAITLRETGTLGAPAADQVGSVRPSAYRPPLYPLLLALVVSEGELPSAAVAGLHAVLGAAMAAITLLLAWRAGLGRWSFLAAALATLDPILLRQSALVMTETLAAFLAVCGVAALARFSDRPSPGRAAAAGAVLGLAMLCRPTFAAWAALLVLAILATRSMPSRFRLAGAMLLSTTAVLAPWTLRNLVQLGSPIFTTTHGGYTLWLANNDLYYDHLLRRSGPFDAERLLAPGRERFLAEVGPEEVALDRRMTREALAVIRRRPRDFACATLHRLHDLWRLAPRQTAGSESTRQTAARIAVGVWYAAVFLAATLGLIARRRELGKSPWRWGLLLGLAFTMVHAFYWTDMRMRAPLMPVVALAAAAGASAMAGKIRRSETADDSA
jgi:hypothetical protein